MELPNAVGMPSPLEGIKVLDCSQILAGPYCSMLLADMGADVVKIEKPGGGDDTRRMGPPFLEGESAAFLAMNRNKRSVVLDFKNPDGVAAMRRMLVDADVVIENYRAGVMGRLGLDYEAVKELNPGIIYCSISGFGRTGPYAERAGFDLIAQGMSGGDEFYGDTGVAAGEGRSADGGFECGVVFGVWDFVGLYSSVEERRGSVFGGEHHGGGAGVYGVGVGELFCYWSDTSAVGIVAPVVSAVSGVEDGGWAYHDRRA